MEDVEEPLILTILSLFQRKIIFIKNLKKKKDVFLKFLESNNFYLEIL